MAAFLDDISPFMGEQLANEQGETLEEFLEKYDPNKYQNPSVTADIMVFWAMNQPSNEPIHLKILLIRRKNHPSIGWWALPGGFVDIKEDVDLAARRELYEETGLTNIPMEQLYTWGDYNRDPRTRIVTVSYIAVLEKEHSVKAGDDAQDAAWFDVSFHLEEEYTNQQRKVQIYHLNLSNPLSQTKVSAKVEHSYQLGGILLDEKFKVLESNHLAFDHPAFITKGLLHLANRGLRSKR